MRCSPVLGVKNPTRRTPAPSLVMVSARFFMPLRACTYDMYMLHDMCTYCHMYMCMHMDMYTSVQSGVLCPRYGTIRALLRTSDARECGSSFSGVPSHTYVLATRGHTYTSASSVSSPSASSVSNIRTWRSGPLPPVPMLRMLRTPPSTLRRLILLC